MAKQYVLALVNKENGVFGIHFPDYPGCVSGGSTFEEAVSRGANALVFHLQGMADDGDPISAPRQAEEALASVRDELADGAMPAIIEVEFPGRAVRVNISIEEGLLSQVDKAATSSGQSRSAFLADAARVRLRNAG
jgi:predicted RNase H-like HicB family nuclease